MLDYHFRLKHKVEDGTLKNSNCSERNNSRDNNIIKCIKLFFRWKIRGHR